MDIEDDKKLLQAMWAWLQRYRVRQFYLTLLTVILFAGANPQDLPFNEDSSDAGMIVLALAAIPFFILHGQLLRLENFSPTDPVMRKATFITFVCFIGTAYLLHANEVKPLIASTFVKLTGVWFGWALCALRSSVFRNEKV